jgi:hypothetical protein
VKSHHDDTCDGELFEHLQERDEPPPIGAALEAALAGVRPVAPRRPGRQFVALAGASIVYAAALVAVLSVRADLGALPRSWLIASAVVWLASFLGLSYLATVPRAGEVMPRWRAAGIVGAITSALLVLLGLAGARHAPGVSVVHDPTVANLVRHAPYCLGFGMVTAIVPVALTVLVLRGAVPIGARWVGFAVGAASGALGGLMLHLHCATADRLHLGLVHGGVVLVAGALGAMVVPRLIR